MQQANILEIKGLGLKLHPWLNSRSQLTGQNKTACQAERDKPRAAGTAHLHGRGFTGNPKFRPTKTRLPLPGGRNSSMTVPACGGARDSGPLRRSKMQSGSGWNQRVLPVQMGKAGRSPTIRCVKKCTKSAFGVLK